MMSSDCTDARRYTPLAENEHLLRDRLDAFPPAWAELLHLPLTDFERGSAER
jgi:hypothetical protein